MKYFVFTDKKLNEGYYFTGSSSKIINVDSLNNSESLCFVIPNEMLKHCHYKSALKNKQNLYAAIQNFENKNSLTQMIDEEVLETNLKDNYYVIQRSHLSKIKTKIGFMGDSALIISDACFYATLSPDPIKILDNVYLIDKNKCLKLSIKSATVAKIKFKEDIKLEIPKSEINLTAKISFFSIKQLFHFSKIKRYVVMLVSIILLFNLIGIINLINNQLKINNIDNNITELFTSILPLESPINIDQKIQNKLQEYNLNNNTSLDILQTLFANIPEETFINFVQYEYGRSKIIINCTFPNDIQESVFIRNMKINGIELDISFKDKRNNIVITEFEYDI